MMMNAVEPLVGRTFEYKVVHFCGGIGGCSLGMKQSLAEYRGVQGKFRTLYSVDVDKGACEAYEKITGAKAYCADLFNLEQYRLFHGAEPPAGWREITYRDLRAWGNEEYPDVIFISAPCKGFSGLLPNAAAAKPKYQALNMLGVRALALAMEAWGDDPPAVILFENVPGIKTRGTKMLAEIRALLGSYGYVFHEGTHDCGEIGHLGQRRVRFLMIARNPKKLPSFIYQPPKHKHRSIGEVLGPLPMPGDTDRGGPMHRMPNLAWKTWERLAMIPAGKDWRALKDLNHTPQNGTYRIVPWGETAPTVTTQAQKPGNAGFVGVADPRVDSDRFGSNMRVSEWEKPSPTITGARLDSGSVIVADPRTVHYNNIMKIMPWDDPSYSITSGSGMQSGGLAVADPRTAWSRYKVVKWDAPAPAVIGQSNVKGSAASVADPRMPGCKDRFHNAYQVQLWDKPSPTIIGQTDIQTGALSVADPRFDHPTWRRTSVGKVTGWDETAGAVIATPNLSGAGTASVADPRISEKWSGAGNFKVMPWELPANAVTANGDIHAGAAAVADPRVQGMAGGQSSPAFGGSSFQKEPFAGTLPAADVRGIWVIVAEDGTWHRPITTFEMAMLQGLPWFVNGKPLTLPGNSDAKWREWIGNMVPVQAGTAMGNALLATMLPNTLGDWHWDVDGNELWVQPGDKRPGIGKKAAG